ncbi:uncharacterized protein M421DRAFT_201058 [Didymella exigua CBS 183.55]|uniref:Subtelomeric hrmA-associated cluster protein AFUB-079030/YDR124W-like helical bundle domain-containing protein n=1 Tax=Didymella exigua CBS 183.55 TaxID=1150837 RepID=A0A6A5S2Q6_9PLEO|nr:uncharacterized protein M421DRAFT_201058 [Didymella exigua CBS 183.55]KAF1933608.1 hypothetical protein M421DRAFT_201058 [Didymella exigua CBS 183.55]
MARFEIDPAPAMNIKTNQKSSSIEEHGDDPFALTENCDYYPPSKAAKAAAPATSEDNTTEDKDDQVAIPIPIATLVFQDGRTEPVYTPLLGHEHLFKARPMTSSPASSSSRSFDCNRPIQAAPSQIPGTSQHTTWGPQQKAGAPKKSPACKQRKPVAHKQGILKSKSLKRSRSVAQGLGPNRKAVTDDTSFEDAESAVEVVTEESHTFYIGDIDAFKKFLTRRFDELTMKPLRGIATHWVKLIEPRRLGDWGKYHEMKPSEAETPPWWPRDVIYKEPSHLKKEDLSTLAVEMMLVHREIDEVKRKGPWISKLRDVAKFTVQTTSADHFSSSKGAVHSEEMKKRALEQILPSIFEVAQAYEDHIMQYNLIEGSGNKDPGRGRHHTWKPIPRPIRRQQPKRPRRATRSERVQETVYEASGDETEPDDTMTRLSSTPFLHGLPQAASSPQPMVAHTISESQTPRHSIVIEDGHRQGWKVDTPPVSGPCTPVTSQDDCMMHRTTSTPNSSFDQSLHGLHLEEDDLDMKPRARTMSDHGSMQPPYDMPSYTQPLQFQAAPAPTGFSGQPYRQRADGYASQPSTFAQNAPTFVNPFAMFNAPPPPIGYSQYASPMPTASVYSYEQGVYPPTPMSFPNTPMNMPMTPSDGSMTYHGLPTNYSVDTQGVHHF